MKRQAIFLVSSFLVMFIAPNTLQATPPDGACHAEVQKLCPNMKPGAGFGQCLRDNKSKLSPDCQTKVEERKQHMRATVDACKGDYEQFCKGIPMGDGRIRKCMSDHYDKLSAGCKASIPPRK